MSFSLGNKLLEIAQSTSSSVFVHPHEDFALPENLILQLFSYNQILISFLHSMTAKQRTGKKNGAKMSPRYFGFIIFSPLHAFLATLSQVFYKHSADHIYYFFAPKYKSTKSASEIHQK